MQTSRDGRDFGTVWEVDIEDRSCWSEQVSLCERRRGTNVGTEDNGCVHRVEGFLLFVTFVIFCHCIVAKMLLGLCNYDVVLFSYVKC